MSTKRNILIIIIGCLFFGGVMGWLVRGGGGKHPDREHTHIDEDGVEYTCSMHPQIRQNEPGQCPLCGMALTPASQKKTDSSPYVLEMSPEAVALSNVMTTQVKSGETGSKVQLSGKIQPNEKRIKSLTANFSGRIDALFVSFTGEEVRKGQKLATLYSPELVNAQKELLETAKIKERQPSLYRAAKEKLRLWNISEEQIAAIEAKGEVRTQFDIYADVSGVVTGRNVAVGDFINRGSVLFEIIDLNQVWVVLDAYESDLSALKRGDSLTFQVAAYPGKEYKATITYIDPILNVGTRTVAIRAEAPNPGLQLKPEMFVSATIQTRADQEKGLLIPKSAVLWTGPRAVVYVQVGDKNAPAFEMREVILGNRVGDNYLLESGLRDGEEVVSNGLFSIDAAAQLSGNYSMMSQAKVKSLEVPEAFSNQLTQLVIHYTEIKDALVKSDAQAVNSHLSKTMSALEKVDMGLLEGQAHDTWMALLRPMKSSMDDLGKTMEIEEQRKHFEVLSNQVIEAVEYFGITGDAVYRQYCPMAFRDNGAYWLSFEKEVRNPYFGDQMLTCGEVKEVYSAGQRVMAREENSRAKTHAH
ncbi:efflux RND transporter periplasmic adaptor subunit [Pararhodonellum marinum]|uniref:efflux RND transporter periplasmic adaptor subunit n=1 Tax=Pararhodonellum marinum TaxID=2755358 RepID=UPI00188DDE32|nr:efflux RND transporter periplasmic adaptor subunit [Pararhodonellum marinum]